jgi:hypothetical protein
MNRHDRRAAEAAARRGGAEKKGGADGSEVRKALHGALLEHVERGLPTLLRQHGIGPTMLKDVVVLAFDPGHPYFGGVPENALEKLGARAGEVGAMVVSVAAAIDMLAHDSAVTQIADHLRTTPPQPGTVRVLMLVESTAALGELPFPGLQAKRVAPGSAEVGASAHGARPRSSTPRSAA